MESYRQNCGKTEEVIDSYIRNCEKDETVIDAYALSCQSSFFANNRTVYIPFSVTIRLQETEIPFLSSAVKENGTIHIMVRDLCGNSAEKSVEINNIREEEDNSGPMVDIFHFKSQYGFLFNNIFILCQ